MWDVLVRGSGVQTDMGIMWAERESGRGDGCSSDSYKSSCEERGRGDSMQSRR